MNGLLVLLIVASVVMSLALCYGLWWVIVKWIMSDAPPNTRFAGINNYTKPEEDGAASSTRQ